MIYANGMFFKDSAKLNDSFAGLNETITRYKQQLLNPSNFQIKHAVTYYYGVIINKTDHQKEDISKTLEFNHIILSLAIVRTICMLDKLREELNLCMDNKLICDAIKEVVYLAQYSTKFKTLNLKDNKNNQNNFNIFFSYDVLSETYNLLKNFNNGQDFECTLIQRFQKVIDAKLPLTIILGITGVCNLIFSLSLNVIDNTYSLSDFNSNFNNVMSLITLFSGVLFVVGSYKLWEDRLEHQKQFKCLYNLCEVLKQQKSNDALQENIAEDDTELLKEVSKYN